MMNSARYRETTLRMVVAATLSYLLVVSTCAPLSVAEQSFSKKRLTIQQQSIAPFREVGISLGPGQYRER